MQMKSPWTDNDKAYSPMFTESVVISGTRGQDSFRQTIEAAVFVDNTGDALTDDAIDTDREDIDIVCRRKDYAFVQKLVRGDLVERTAYNGIRYAIKEIKNDAVMGLVISARSK